MTVSQPVGRSPDPAIGWALGMERLLLVLEAAAQADPPGAAARLTATSITGGLRGEPRGCG